MACYHPSKVAVNRRLPVGVRADLVTVPCGKCLGCRADQARDWAIRLVHEADVRQYAWFVTLTYSDESLPTHGTLCPEHLRAFFKALRKLYPPRSLSYYACGEYGESTARPHYHAVLCGPPLLDRDLLDVRPTGPVWRSDTLASVWPHGLHEFSAVTFQSAAYVAGYVRKKVERDERPREFAVGVGEVFSRYERVDPSTGELVYLQPEFARMSRRPGIGRLWLERYWTDVYPRDFVVMDGREFKPPRYYDKWMEENHPQIMEEVRYQRYLDQEEFGDEQLIMKEKVHRARVRLFNPRSKV